jgi:Uma2 family endonuclease
MKLSADRLTRPRKKTTRNELPSNISLASLGQREWSEEEYLDLESQGGRLIELVDGFIEVLPMADLFHQSIALYLYRFLFAFVSENGLGEVLSAPLPIHLWDKNLREPDIIFLKSHRIKDRHTPPEGADLVMEVVSPGKKSRERDLKVKRKAYAKAKIPEYWVVDPEQQLITVFTLGARSYRTRGKYKPGEQATSNLLAGFKVDVRAVFAAGLGK